MQVLVKLLANLILTSACLMTISACSKTETDFYPKDLIRIDIGSEPPTIDPTLSEDTASTRLAFDLFAGLVDFDQQNNVIPGMAFKWDVSADGKIYTFYLRRGLKFSDGSEITANDFVYTFRRLVDPKVAAPYNMLINDIVNAQQVIDNKMPISSLGVFAPDLNTFIVKLVNRDPTFIQRLTLSNVSVVPQKIINKFGNKWTDPANIVTSGAYVLKEHVIHGYILATKNPYYYDESNVHIQNVRYLPYEDKNATIPAYKSGGLDVTFQGLPVDQLIRLKQEYKEQLHVVSQEASYYYDFNWHDRELAKNLKLRQALSMAVDRQVLVNNVLRGGQVPLYSVVTPTIENGKYKDLTYAWESWPRDRQITEAKKLYKEAGYGLEHPFKTSISYNTNDLHKKTALVIAYMWKSVLGVETSLENQEWKTFIQKRHKGDYQIARDGWIADYNSVTTYINLYQCNNQQNNSHYCNPEFNKYIVTANREKDQDKQTALYKQALQLPLNDYAVIPIFQYAVQVLVKPYVINYTPEINHLYHTQTKWMSLK